MHAAGSINANGTITIKRKCTFSKELEISISDNPFFFAGVTKKISPEMRENACVEIKSDASISAFCVKTF